MFSSALFFPLLFYLGFFLSLFLQTSGFLFTFQYHYMFPGTLYGSGNDQKTWKLSLVVVVSVLTNCYGGFWLSHDLMSSHVLWTADWI